MDLVIARTPQPLAPIRTNQIANGVDITILFASRDDNAQPCASAQLRLHVRPDNATDARWCDGAGAAADEGHEGAQFVKKRCEHCKVVRRKGGKRHNGYLYIICKSNPRHK